MRRSELRQKVIRRIRRFELTELELDDLIHAGDLRYDPECEEGELYATILSMIELLPERKRHDLICLMYLGRNLEYYGLNEEVVTDFCAYADEKADGKGSGSIAPEYLAGKVPLSRWLRRVKREIRPDFWSISTRYDGNVELRDITEDDADFMLRLVSDPMVTRFLPGMIQDREMLLSWIQSLGSSDHEYIVRIEEIDEVIGECSLTKQGDNAEIGFMLLPKYWLLGYGTEVVTSLIEIARDMRLKELTATTDARNHAAIRLLKKCGFKQQKNGWMVVIPEGEESKIEGGQSIIQFQRRL